MGLHVLSYSPKSFTSALLFCHVTCAKNIGKVSFCLTFQSLKTAFLIYGIWKNKVIPTGERFHNCKKVVATSTLFYLVFLHIPVYSVRIWKVMENSFLFQAHALGYLTLD
jgi:hypothetical protein